MTIRNNLTRMAFLAGLPVLANANDIYIAPRGPTNWQIDFRAGYSEKTDDNGNTTKTTTQNDVLKYWDGDKFGWFGYANIPAYKEVNNGKSSSRGFGDVALGFGPRGTFYLDEGKSGSFHWIGYSGAVLPTADVRVPVLGNDRIDIKSGAFFTYLTPKKKAEIDMVVDYICAGKNGKGVQGQDSISGGIIVGGIVFDNENWEIKLAAGINGQFRKNLKERSWDNCFGPREVVRFTPKFKSGKKPGHLEIVADQDVWKKNMPAGFSVLTQLRVNF
jgi:hypothetical protein